MASQEGWFVEEIDFHELHFGEVVDRGAFGVVSRAHYRGTIVAVKLIETEQEKKAFFTELKQLSRVNHQNIVRLIGACTKPPTVCLVMEYAEGGSLYNVLHGERCANVEYTSAHAMSWSLQCAQGVEYLHGMKPRPLVHRDLKPPNLLLVQGGTQLKICDFGTACDAHTHMTNNKGSAAWMAPEVFEGSDYSEKCDVFSFGIILWEVITRKKPFDEIGGPAFRIMWAVHNGTRPPLITDCPKPVEQLMTRCWSANPMERPSMAEVARIMSHLYKLFKGGDVPLVYPVPADANANILGPGESSFISGGGASLTKQQSLGTPTHETVRRIGEPIVMPPVITATRQIIMEVNSPQDADYRRTSAPASLAASQESLLDHKGSRSSTPVVDTNKRYSADFTNMEGIEILPQKPPSAPGGFVRGHRRTGSHGTPFIPPIVEDANHLSPNWSPSNQGNRPVKGHRRTGSYGNAPTDGASVFTGISNPSGAPTSLPLHHSTTAPANLNQPATPDTSWTPGAPVNIMDQLLSSGSDNAALSLAMAAMDYQLQPLAPRPTCSESVQIFQQHCDLAKEYLRVQAEIALLTQRKHELLRDLENEEKEKQSSTRQQEELAALASENESLLLLHKNLTKQVEWVRKQERQNKREAVPV